MALDPSQESQLTSGGDCFSHYHSSDRIRTHGDGQRLIELEVSVFYSDGAYSIKAGVNYALVDSSAGDALLTLPDPTKQTTVTVLRTSATNVVTITSLSGLINGASSFTLAGAYAFAKFKAIDGNYYRVG